MKRELIKQFTNPSTLYRGKPFWAWNGRLEEDELRRQIRLMYRMGLGGFFMHSRVGLATPYLSPEWFRLVGACVDEAAKLDMEAWLYDEDRWPSGAAGGLVTRNPKYRQRFLVMEQISRLKLFRQTPDIVALFTAQLVGTTATRVKRIVTQSMPRLAKGDTLLIFRVQTAPCSDWYNGYTYLDTLSHEAVRAFIQTTHEAYWKHLGRHFGKEIPGIFTDEPNYGSVLKSNQVPWTAKLLGVFRTRYGYDLAPHLPELFFDVDSVEMSRARYHYYDCITFLFTDAFARQIGEWCARHRLFHTGHVLAEDTLSRQTSVVGNCMRFYEYMQAPGMDLLTEHWRIYDTAKQVSSAARQFGRKWRLTETYGCTGWDFPFAGHKALGDWQVALGINLRCQHLAWYTMEGQAKRDYPAAIFYQSPWWELYPKVEDYFARVHAVMTRGEEVRDILVIHPVESMWTLCRMGWQNDKRVQTYDRMLMALRDSLLTAHLDFDYGDEEILGRHARIMKEKGRPVLRVGKASYHTVVVPPLKTMRRSTLNLLQRFSALGGVVVFAGEPAGYMAAQPSEAVRRLADTCIRAPDRGEGLASAVETGGRRLSIADADGNEIETVLYLLREDEDAFYLFICNTGHKPGQLKPESDDKTMVRERHAAFPDAVVKGFEECAGWPLELNAETGAIVMAKGAFQDGQWTIHTSLPPLGSRLFVIPKQKQRQRFPLPSSYREVRKKRLAGRRWQIALSEPNNLVLDRPRYRIGAGKWWASDEILKVDQAIRSHLGIALRGGAMVQPWARKIKRKFKSNPVELAYSFEVAVLPQGPLFLAIERPECYRMKVNGVELNADADCGWWVDRSLRKIPVDPSVLHVGRNEIHLACEYDERHPGLEIIYLLGELGVRLKGPKPVITAKPDVLKIGDWCRQGLAFYSGSVSYRCSFIPDLRKGERLFVQVPSYRGVAVRILVNGRTAGVIAWEPNEIDITDCLEQKKEANLLQIEVIGHRRNSHGPLHLDRKWPEWTGPGEFLKISQDTYQLVPCGLMASPCLSIRKY